MARASRTTLNSKRRSSTVLRPDDITVSPAIEKNNRQKCQLAIESAFKESPASDNVDVKELSAAIEEEIYKANGANIGPKYKSSMRSHLVNLKNKKNDLRERILSGEVSPQKFAVMSTEEMSTRERIKEDELLKQRNLEAHIISQNSMPSNILDVKLHDGRERGKWGVTTSAAAIDYFE
ncbi:transcription factor S-II, central domain-containing protein [Lipomyces chichibuensis]|uniref:transcription factor S-II, central domain-containing protein n=1 Tax=Lipomyces chichibuensis TaxID=1546026 RepID=UPI003343F793